MPTWTINDSSWPSETAEVITQVGDEAVLRRRIAVDGERHHPAVTTAELGGGELVLRMAARPGRRRGDTLVAASRSATASAEAQC